MVGKGFGSRGWSGFAFQSFTGAGDGLGGSAACVQSFAGAGFDGGGATLPHSFAGVGVLATFGDGSGFFGTSCTVRACTGGAPLGDGLGAGLLIKLSLIHI